MSLEPAVPAEAAPAVKAERKTATTAAPRVGPSAAAGTPGRRRLSDAELARAPLARQLATAVQQRAGIAEIDAPFHPGRHIRGPLVQRALPRPGAFKEATSSTLRTRGKTMTEIDRRLNEYHDLLEKLGVRPNLSADAHQRSLEAAISGQITSSLLDPLEQALADLAADTKFWRESHVGDQSTLAKQRRPHIETLHKEASDELREVRRLRKGNPQAGAFDAKESAFVAKMQGSASSVLERLGTAIGKALPLPGDSVDARVQVKIPCDPTGAGYVGFRIRAQAWRQDGKATKVRADISVLGGGMVANIVDIGGALGVLVEAQGKTPEQAMLLISYAWYRRFREMSVLPREVVNFMWGGSVDKIGWTRSEQWAANVEQASFVRAATDVPLSTGVGTKATKNEYVRMAALAGASAQAGAGGVAKLAGEVEAQAGTHWDKVSLTKAIEKDKKRAAKKGRAPRRTEIGKPMAQPGRGATLALGTSYGGVALTFKADVGPLKGEVNASVSLMGRLQGENTALWDEHELAIPAGYISLAGTLGLAVPLAPPVALPLIFRAIKTELAPILVEKCSRLSSRYDHSGMKEGMAAAQTSLAGALGSLDPHAGASMLADAAVGTMLAPVLLRMDLAAGYQLGGGVEGWTFEISISQVTGVAMDVGVAGLKLKRRERLMRLILTNDKSAKATARDELGKKRRKLREARTGDALEATMTAYTEVDQAEQIKAAASDKAVWKWQFD